ncbi:MAG: endonuclease [Silanimonas sp.]
MSNRPFRAVAALGLAAFVLPAQAEVFINEIHYDNAGSDTGERVELIATAGEDLTQYRVVLYNGSSSSTSASAYDDDRAPTGSNVNCGGNVRIAVITYPANGLQNGAFDGLALVNGAGQVVQFLSYEGTIRAGSGVASGRTSQNLSVSESDSTAAGTSLQLGGSGSTAADFAWQSSRTQTFGACNANQSFVAPNPPPAVTSTTPANGATSVSVTAALAVSFNESVTAGTGAFALSCASSGTHPLTYPASGSSFTLTPSGAFTGGESCTLTVNASAIRDAGNAAPTANTSVTYTLAAAAPTGYYSRVNTSSASQLRCSLHATIKGHTAYPYSSSSTDTWDVLEIADEDPANTSRILDVYKNRSYAKVSDRAGTGSGVTYNREHVWPNSLGFGSQTGNLGLPYAPYTDTHMLYLSDTAYNSDRGNKPYANCPASSGCGERATEVNNGTGGGTGVYPGNSNWVKGPDGNTGSFEVFNARKGDVARAILYMAIRYEGGTHPVNGQSEPDLELTDDRSKIVITSASPAYMGLLSTLLQWHQQDPPNAAEVIRNEAIQEFQGNRNPFIDHPEWATQALFTSTKPASCQLL